MNSSISTKTLQERIGKYSNELTKTVQGGNVRGIGVEGILRDSNSHVVSRSKARILKKMSPSLDRGLQILSGMIACPEGGVRTNLNYTFGDVKGLTEEKRNQIITTLKDYFEHELDMENKLHDLVYRVISEEGADVEVYIPYTMVDDALGLESSGMINPDKMVQVKDFTYKSETNTCVSNSMNLLTQTPLSIKSQVGNEAADAGRSRLSRINANVIALNRQNNPGAEGVVVRHTTGQAVIPILYNGRVIKYIGLLDEMGNFLKNGDEQNFVDLMAQTEDTTDRAQYEILGHDSGFGRGTAETENERHQKIRTSIEDDVIMAITGKSDKNGLDDILGSLGEENVIDILTSRALMAKKTRVIMIDPEYVSYFSILKNENGRGITVIDDNSSIILLHVTLLYAKILSELESSIPKTKAEVTLDERDEDSDATLKDIMGELAMSAVPDYNLDYTGNRQLFRSLSKMNTSVNVRNANIPGMANMDIEIDRKQDDVRGPTSDLLDMVGKFATQTLGISAEHVDNSYSEKFKLQVTRDNDITSRQLMRYVSAVDESLTERGRKRVAHNDVLWDELIKIIGGKKAEQTLIEILSTFSIKLPELTSTKFENLSANMDSIYRAIKDYVDAAIPDSVVDGGERIDRDTLGTMRQMVTGAVMRAYAANTDIFGGLGIDLTSMAGIAEVINGELEEYGDEFKKMTKHVKKYNKVVQDVADKVEGDEEEQPDETPPASDEPATTDVSEGDGEPTEPDDLPDVDDDVTEEDPEEENPAEEESDEGDTPPEDDDNSEGGGDDVPEELASLI